MDTRAITPGVNMYAQQMELEAAMTELGVSRFERLTAEHREKERENEAIYGTNLIAHHVDALARRIDEWVKDAYSGKAKRKALAATKLKDIDPQVSAYLTLRGITASLSRPKTLVAVTTLIGGMIEDEIHLRSLREEDKRFHDFLREEVAKRDRYDIKRQVANRYAKIKQPDYEPWTAANKHKVGMALVDLAIEATGFVRLVHVKDQTTVIRGKMQASRPMLAPTEETLAWMEEKIENAALMSPIYEPMIVEPVPWTQPTGGGYMSRFVRPLKAVKTRSRNYLKELEGVHLERVYGALNAAQQTAWRINPLILEVLSFVWENGSTHGNIPSKWDEEFPPKPWDIDTNEEAKKVWKSQASKVRARNRMNTAKRLQFASALGTATKYSRFESIYFPYQMDFRGRIYAVPAFNPQGTDYVKGLLQFSDGVPLGDDGWTWLAVHIANCGAYEKMDKQPLADRVQWVEDNKEKIIACAEDPYENLWWTEADSPYMFLAACFEWANLVRHISAGEDPATFVSYLPVALDGSCSGIQHFSIAFRDGVGGAAVNLVPAERPADIYSLVAEQVEGSCRAIAGADLDPGLEDDDRLKAEARRDLAAQWLTFGISRSLCKRPTMTFGYGSNLFGFREQVHVDTLLPAYRQFQKTGDGVWPFEDDGYKASVFMAREIRNAVNKVVVKASEAMSWLIEVARHVAAEDLPIRWSVPDGFPVVQAYRELKSRKVQSFMAGGTIKTTISVAEEGPKVDRRAQAQGISPNFIHSLDACHLRMVVMQAFEEGMSDFALVHDSFGVHAGHTARFFVLIREVFVEMYRERDVIMDFLEDVRTQISEDRRDELACPPMSGNLDIEKVIESDYCFA